MVNAPAFNYTESRKCTVANFFPCQELGKVIIQLAPERCRWLSDIRIGEKGEFYYLETAVAFVLESLTMYYEFFLVKTGRCRRILTSTSTWRDTRRKLSWTVGPLMLTEHFSCTTAHETAELMDQTASQQRVRLSAEGPTLGYEFV